MSSAQLNLDEIRFMASLNNTKLFHSILKAIQFVDVATVQLTNLGIRVFIEDSHTLQASVCIQKDDTIFDKYHFLVDKNVPEDETDFSSIGINLKILNEHLNMFVDMGSRLSMIYKGEGSPFTLILEHDVECLTTQCDINTRVGENKPDFEFDDNDAPCHVQFKGPDFYSLIDELHKTTPQAEQLEFTCSPSAPHFVIKSLGCVDAKTEYALDKSSEMVTDFKSQEFLSFRYKWTHLKLLLKTLSIAAFSSVAMDKRGLLLIKSTVADDQQHLVTVEYLMLAAVNEDDIL